MHGAQGVQPKSALPSRDALIVKQIACTVNRWLARTPGGLTPRAFALILSCVRVGPVCGEGGAETPPAAPQAGTPGGHAREAEAVAGNGTAETEDKYAEPRLYNQSRDGSGTR